MPSGTVIFILDRGFGFIRRTDEPDLFFHRSKIAQSDVDAIRAGSRVTFEIETAPNGKLCAVHVKLLEQQKVEATDDALGALAWERKSGDNVETNKR